MQAPRCKSVAFCVHDDHVCLRSLSHIYRLNVFTEVLASTARVFLPTKVRLGVCLPAPERTARSYIQSDSRIQTIRFVRTVVCTKPDVIKARPFSCVHDSIDCNSFAVNKQSFCSTFAGQATVLQALSGFT